jgi:hypothetical protein
MRCLFFVVVLFFCSCKSLSETEKFHQTLVGDWLIVYPDHKLNNSSQRAIYGKIQDSIVGLRGLKLIILSDEGIFQQTDDLSTKGKWGITPDNIAFVQDGGQGFENFSARFTGFKNGMLQLTEVMNVKGEKITLVWHLKKMESNATTAMLFSEESNSWRRQPKQKEPAEKIKARLSAMLEYYAAYYSLVNKEASYFIASRVILPLKFYQHAIGLKSLENSPGFVSLFLDVEQAQEAHRYLGRTMDRLDGKFPSLGSSYVEEYAEFMKMMANEVVKLD